MTKKNSPQSQAKRDYQRKAKSLWRKQNPEKNMWYNARTRAKKHGIPFLILPEDIRIPANCPILGIPLKKGQKSYCDSSPSLEFIRPELGFAPGNIAVISWRANKIKNNATPEEVIAVAEWLRKVT